MILDGACPVGAGLYGYQELGVVAGFSYLVGRGYLGNAAAFRSAVASHLALLAVVYAYPSEAVRIAACGCPGRADEFVGDLFNRNGLYLQLIVDIAVAVLVIRDDLDSVKIAVILRAGNIEFGYGSRAERVAGYLLVGEHASAVSVLEMQLEVEQVLTAAVIVIRVDLAAAYLNADLIIGALFGELKILHGLLVGHVVKHGIPVYLVLLVYDFALAVEIGGAVVILDEGAGLPVRIVGFGIVLFIHIDVSDLEQDTVGNHLTAYDDI